MLRRKIIVAIIAITSFVMLGSFLVAPRGNKPRNLKVLPKDISEERLDSIMDTYNEALGVKCGFCHLPSKSNKEELDFALDGEPMKEEARKMIRMTININKTNFWYDKKQHPAFLTTVHCNTCHRGEAFPEH